MALRVKETGTHQEFDLGKKQSQQQLDFPRPLGPLTQFADAHK